MTYTAKTQRAVRQNSLTPLVQVQEQNMHFSTSTHGARREQTLLCSQPHTFYRESNILLIRVTVQLKELLEFLLIFLFSFILLLTLNFWEVQVFKLEKTKTNNKNSLNLYF